ncbi:hypothetical protein [Saccharopolyspora sp. NPDC002376]
MRAGLFVSERDWAEQLAGDEARRVRGGLVEADLRSLGLDRLDLVYLRAG